MSIYEQAVAQVRRSHVTQVSEQGWSCSCAAGRTWPIAPVSRARAAANAHLRAEVRRIVRRTERVTR